MQYKHVDTLFMPNIYNLELIFSFQYSNFTIIRHMFLNFWHKNNQSFSQNGMVTQINPTIIGCIGATKKGPRGCLGTPN